MSVLIICEKPSVAKTVALALGAAEQKDGYLSGDGLLVSWCIGHLISMADAGSYDERYKKWRYEDLPILPQTWKYAPRAPLYTISFSSAFYYFGFSSN